MGLEALNIRPYLVLKAWRIPGESLVFSPQKLLKLGSHLKGRKRLGRCTQPATSEVNPTRASLLCTGLSVSGKPQRGAAHSSKASSSLIQSFQKVPLTTHPEVHLLIEYRLNQVGNQD